MKDAKNLTVKEYCNLVEETYQEIRARPINSWSIFTKAWCWLWRP